jgi:phosphoketolase
MTEENEEVLIEEPIESLKPFSMGYVLKTTARHMRKSVDLSIRKTFERIVDFSEDKAKSQEIFETLSSLHMMKKQLDDFVADNADKFKVGNDDGNEASSRKESDEEVHVRPNGDTDS